ncbi:MAG: flavodoxin-dependent (E)-4-hydroxy-3-methylbut-2-enyl-diphosphate synthase [Candidatus Aminicenantales bacterium]
MIKNAFPRRKTKQLKIGGVAIGGGAPVVVQSMTKTLTHHVARTVAQIKRLEKEGCQIVRLAVPDERAAAALKTIRKCVSIPIIADIHFDHRLALAALRAGVDGLRLNPGTIGSKDKVREVVRAARERRVPIRIGVNSGSVEKDILAKHGGASPEAMVESALDHIRLLEDLEFDLIKVSLKASDVGRTVAASRLLAEKVDYPFHAGITESGSLLSGSVKSAVGLGILLAEGLADTIRVSLTAPPEEEVRVAFWILRSLGLGGRHIDFVSCPTCGRAEVDLMRIVPEVEKRLSAIRVPLTVALMGCMVNGPGEAKDADIGIACGRRAGVLFKKGRLVRRVDEKKILAEIVREVKKMAGEPRPRGKD